MRSGGDGVEASSELPIRQREMGRAAQHSGPLALLLLSLKRLLSFVNDFANLRIHFAGPKLLPSDARQLLVILPHRVEVRVLHLLEVQQGVVRPSTARINSSSLMCIAAVSRFCVFWIRNTMRNVMIVVPVLITSCHVSLKPNMGPVTAQTTMIVTAVTKANGCPVAQAAHFAKTRKA